MRPYFLILFFYISVSSAQARIDAYPSPSGILASNQYSVRLIQAGKAVNSFVYLVNRQRDKNKEKSTSWTSFSFDSPIEVEVTKLQGTFRSVRVFPSMAKINPSILGHTVRFKLSKPAQLSIEFDQSISDPMLVFANPPEVVPPNAKEQNLVYFGPGIHDIGSKFDPTKGRDPNRPVLVYLAGGSYVRGTFSSNAPKGMIIRGRGILTGEKIIRDQSVHSGIPPMIEFVSSASRDNLIEGITLIQSPFYNIHLHGSNNSVRNVKVLSWYGNTDGVQVGLNEGGVIEDSFFKVDDDAIKLTSSHLLVRRCTIWQMDNGIPFLISWNTPNDVTDVRVEDSDVIHSEAGWGDLATFGAFHGGKGRISHFTFDNIRIENSVWRTFFLSIAPNPYADSKAGLGSMSNFLFKNIQIFGKPVKPNVIRGFDRSHTISQIHFLNVSLNAVPFLDATSGNFQIDRPTVSDVQFMGSSRN